MCEPKPAPIVRTHNLGLPDGAYWVRGFAMVVKSEAGQTLYTKHGFETRSAARPVAIALVAENGYRVEVVRECITPRDGRTHQRLQFEVELSIE